MVIAKKEVLIPVGLFLLCILLVFSIFVIRKTPVFQGKKFYEIEAPKSTLRDFGVTAQVSKFGDIIVEKKDDSKKGVYTAVGTTAGSAYEENGNWYLPVILSDTEKVYYDFGSGKNTMELYVRGEVIPKVDSVENILPTIIQGTNLVVPFNFDIEMSCPEGDNNDFCKKVVEDRKKKMDESKKLLDDRQKGLVSLDNMKLGQANMIILEKAQK